MKRTYLDRSVLIQAVQGVDGDKTAVLMEDPERAFVAATLKEAGAVPLTAVDVIHVAAAKALKCDEFITAEKPGKPLHKARGLKVSFLPAV